ncbi:MAG TPA: hypothetical protein VMG37_18110 [Solirubrobacteraceae bacterium]|nr:hypothetical protein [Solirubrobacteraceae bacterium]
MATSVRPRPLADAATSRAVVSIAYAAGAVLLAAVAAVHVQQFADLFYGVSWIGPLFIALAAGCVLVIAGLAYPPTRRLAALAGVAVSVLALGGLVVSYGQGLFGWQEVGFRTPIAVAAVSEVLAVIALALGLTVESRS